MDEKQCSRCKLVKPYSEFHKSKERKDGLQHKCKECNKIAANDWNRKNKDRHRENNRNPSDEVTFRRRATRYGLTVTELRNMLTEANNTCEICGRVPETYVVVDHCHKSLKVRGILCGPCNQSLGLMKENTEWLESMIQYIKKHNN